MLHALLESGRPRAPRPTALTLASVLGHVALIGAAIAVTNRVAVPPVALEPQEKIIYTVPRQTLSPTTLHSAGTVSESVWRAIRELRRIAIPAIQPIDLEPATGATLG